MASLMEELLQVLHDEETGYQRLLSMADAKKESIIRGEVDVLEKITEDEQEISSDLKALENKRLHVLRDMAVVLGHDGETLTVTQMADLLKDQPKEQEALIRARDSLTQTASQMQFANQQNQVLLQQALEMVEFDLTLFKSMKQAPETANYDKNAYNTGDILGNSGFDAKQ